MDASVASCSSIVRYDRSDFYGLDSTSLGWLDFTVLALPSGTHFVGAARRLGLRGDCLGRLRRARVASRVRRRCSGQPMGMNLRDARRRVSS